LAGHSIYHQQHLLWVGALADGSNLVHQGLVNMQAAGGVKQQDGQRLLASPLYRAGGNVYGFVALRLRVDGDVELATELLELGHGGGTLHVGGDHARLLAVFAEVVGELGDVGGLAGALQADEHEYRGWSASKLDVGFAALAAKHLDQ